MSAILHARTSGCTGCTLVACLPQILTLDSRLASALSMPKDVGMQLKPVLVTTPNMSVQGDNTTPISNDGFAQLGPMVQS